METTKSDRPTPMPACAGPDGIGANDWVAAWPGVIVIAVPAIILNDVTNLALISVVTGFSAGTVGDVE